jgi:hypothetical protein
MSTWDWINGRSMRPAAAVDLRASQLDVAGSSLGVQMPMTGQLSANASFTGSLTNPVGRGNISVTQATVSEPIQSATLDFQGTGDEIRSRLRLQMPAGQPKAALLIS